VADLFQNGGGGVPPAFAAAGVEVIRRAPFVRVTARIADATRLGSDELGEQVADRYTTIAAVLASERKRPIRFWNYVPGILDWMHPGLDRYMAFNRGRHAAFSRSWHRTHFECAIPAASGVGIEGEDLVIDALASESGGTAIDNPRQRASWRYSRRYGPRPPCFARGTLTTIDGATRLLVSGTASIVGEESRHPGNVRAQVDEIVRNLEALIVNAGGCAAHPLAQLTDARVYVVRREDGDFVERALRSRTAPGVRIEMALARVCRRELLVEIEGVAALAGC
jgi:hypothetical protein